MPMMTRRSLIAALVLASISASTLTPTSAMAGIADEFTLRLNDTHRQQFQAWRAARHAYEGRLDAYWAAVEVKRAERRKKKAAKFELVASDYIASFQCFNSSFMKVCFYIFLFN